MNSAARDSDDRIARLDALSDDDPAGVKRADVAAITRAVTARLEYYIGEHPEQWTVFQPVWEDRSTFNVQRSTGRVANVER